VWRRKSVIAIGSADNGSPVTGSPMNRCASPKVDTPATARTAFFQSGKDRELENACGSGCLYSQLVDTRYGTFMSKMFSELSVCPPHVDVYRASIGVPSKVAITPRV